MAKSDGTIFIDTLIDTSEFKKLHNEISYSTKELSKLGASVSKIGAGMTVGLTAPIAMLGKSAVESAAEMEAASSQFSQVFGELENQATESLSGIANETGIVEERLLGSYTQIAAFAKTTGIETADALELSNRAMAAVADSAAFYDRSLEDTAESLRSFLKGNYENDAALGLSATEFTRNAAAMELYGQSFNDLSESQKQFTLLKMVEDANALSGALGQASRESDTWSNVTGNMSQEFTNLAASLGKNLLPILIPVVKGITDIIDRFGELDPSTQKVIVAVLAVVAAIGPLATVIGGIISAITTILPIIGAVVGAITPVGIAVAAVAAAVAVLIANWKDVKAAMVIFGNYLNDVFSQDFTKIFGGVLGGAINGFVESVKQLWDDIKQIFSGLIDFITGLFAGNWEKAWSGIVNVFMGLWNGLVDLLAAPINIIIGMINGLVGGVVEGINVIIRALNSLDFDIPEWVPFVGGESIGFNIKEITPPKIPYLASGAVIPPNAPFMAMLGDQKHGTNIEAPLDTIKQAVREVIGTGGNGQMIHNVLYLNNRVVYDAVMNVAQAIQDTTGRNPYELT